MRTNIDLDEDLIAKAMELSGLPTKKATVELALRQFVENGYRRQALDELWGIGWEGDLDAMRESWGPPDRLREDAAE
ncbi:MAG TPA: type II toxin-antitoxin system VapB family antitoxin [Shinella sp.]|jgi:Arc/MetJ family transcription regulator|uniref:type II toxin-antitoxin system VapB family antitoxin n=1 Tax=Shinella sp. TaxID=1870904 RepID=UPI0029A3EA39|nr:type II toxin-antitoxin system VapB family antitoxin [Shinella sp.]MDX3973058.1 type II toxin-antitoxin system VapB family antitoxin [Shinella sp.]HEV7251201.1 type II toxin-antitoxin system VapB family antitoxin [Shinella sp.]